MKKFFTMAALTAAVVCVNAEVTPRSPIVPWGAQAEIIITNDLTQQNSDGSWSLTADAQQWISTTYNDEPSTLIQQTNRANVWFDFYDEATDTMVVTSAEKNWGGYLTVTNKAGSTSGLIVVGATRYPHFFITGTDKAKFYFSGSASKAGYPQIEVYEVGAEAPVATYTGDYALTKSTWDHSTLLIADGLDKAKNYEIVARTMALNAETNEYTYDGGDIVLQVVKLYGDQAPMREDGVIISGSEIGGYINAHLAAYPEVTDFTLEGSGKYTITEGITAATAISITGEASAPATINASALKAPLVQMATIVVDDPATDEVEGVVLNEQGFLATSNVNFKNLKINGLAQPLFSSNKQNYLVPELNIDNCLIELANNPFVIDFRNGGVVGKLAVSNSTVWAATATGNSFFTGQSGKKATEAGLEEQIFSFTNSTLSNIAAGKNFFTHRQNGQTWLTYEVKNSIIANCGKDNFLASLNGGQSSPNPKYVVEGITVLKTVKEAVLDGEGNPTEETVDVLSNINDLQSTSDETEEIVNPIEGVPFTLANALAGNFKLTASSQQAKYMTGDPRWKTPYATDAIKIEVDQAENTDFAAVLNEALKVSEQPSSITIQFFEAGEYPLTQAINTTAPITIQNGSDISAGDATIVVNNGMTLGGAIKIDGVNLKAGDEFADPMIVLQGNEYQLQDNGFYNFGKIQLLNATISGFKSQLIYGNKVKNFISEIETKNCEIYMAAGSKTVYDFNGGGVVKTWNFVNSTLDANGFVIFSSQSGQKLTDVEPNGQQTFNISTSTVYRPGKKAFQHRQNSQKWERYILKNSVIIVNPEKPNFVAEMNAGGTSTNPVWEIDGNAFQQITDDGTLDVCDKQNTGDEAEPVKNNIVGAMSFNDLAAGDFGGTMDLAEGIGTPSKLGDPRWTITFNEYEEPSTTFLVQEGDVFTYGQQITAVDDIVMTFGAATDQEHTGQYADFGAGIADASIEGYVAMTNGNGANPKDGNNKNYSEGRTMTNGTFYNFVPEVDGALYVAVKMNANKDHFVTEDATTLLTTKTAEGETIFGEIAFNVTAGKQYQVFSNGSKMGFFGFTFLAGEVVDPLIPTGIKGIQTATVTDGAVYNMNGQRVQTLSKGMYIRDGKKFIVK